MDKEPQFILTTHAREMLIERNISEEWLRRVIDAADTQERCPDGNIHFSRVIEEMGNRILRVVVNDQTIPMRIVTVLLDRRLSKGKQI